MYLGPYCSVLLTGCQLDSGVAEDPDSLHSGKLDFWLHVILSNRTFLLTLYLCPCTIKNNSDTSNLLYLRQVHHFPAPVGD